MDRSRQDGSFDFAPYEHEVFVTTGNRGDEGGASFRLAINDKDAVPQHLKGQDRRARFEIDHVDGRFGGQFELPARRQELSRPGPDAK
jgi:hypothetical protein